MKDILLRSSRLTVHVNAFGAEIKGVEMDGLEYLWQGDVRSYPRTSPTLFPIIGRFLSDTYYVGDRDYRMPLNGFAMDSNFSVSDQTESGVTFVLTASDVTRTLYPFEFELSVRYAAEGNLLTVGHTVVNRGEITMPFCVGCHTAYRWPFFAGEKPELSYLRFERKETLQSFNPFGWRDSFVDGSDIRPLDHGLFSNYTRSLTGMTSTWVELANHAHPHAVRIHRSQYPYLAIWSLPTENAPLICLEPCTSVHPGDRPSLRLEQRDGARLLAPGERCALEFSLEFR